MADNSYSFYFERTGIFENYTKDISCKEYAVARIDGRNFSTFTRGCEKPFDYSIIRSMQYTTNKLCEEWGVDAAYTQSDEISLLWFPKENPNAQFPFSGRLRKLNSLLASSATGYFNSVYPASSMAFYGREITKIANFDCRIFNYPLFDSKNKLEPLIVRQVDCIRNSVQMFAQSIFSHKQLQNKSIKDIKQMLRENNTPWEKIIDMHKYGTYFIRDVREMDENDYYSIPEKYRPEKVPLRTYYSKSFDNKVSSLTRQENDLATNNTWTE